MMRAVFENGVEVAEKPRIVHKRILHIVSFIRLDIQMRTAESASHSTRLPHPVQVQGICIALVVTAYMCIP